MCNCTIKLHCVIYVVASTRELVPFCCCWFFCAFFHIIRREILLFTDFFFYHLTLSVIILLCGKLDSKKLKKVIFRSIAKLLNVGYDNWLTCIISKFASPYIHFLQHNGKEYRKSSNARKIDLKIFLFVFHQAFDAFADKCNHTEWTHVHKFELDLNRSLKFFPFCFLFRY